MKKIKSSPLSKSLLLGVCLLVFLPFLSKYIALQIGLDSEKATIIVGVMQALASLISALLIVYQLAIHGEEEKKLKEIEEAKFINHYNEFFLGKDNIVKILSLLNDNYWFENAKQGERLISDKYRPDLIAYLVYLEGMAPIILYDLMELDKIDDLLSLRFFMAVNNKQVQDERIKKSAPQYKGIYKLYIKWAIYKKHQGEEIFQGNIHPLLSEAEIWELCTGKEWRDSVNKPDISRLEIDSWKKIKWENIEDIVKNQLKLQKTSSTEPEHKQ